MGLYENTVCRSSCVTRLCLYGLLYTTEVRLSTGWMEMNTLVVKDHIILCQ